MTTKELAKQLGLIRRSSKLSLKTKNSSSSKTNQFFHYLIIIDFESTCWKDTKHYGQEIIEFPAVLLNTAHGEIESEFHTYVQPQEHPVLSDFCMELTGIKQQQVDDGAPLKICLSQFSTWIQKLQKEKHITFPGVSPTPTSPEEKMCGFVTWSDWDLGVCLLYECRRKQLRKPDILNAWIDLRLTYKLFYNRRPKGLNGALQDVGIEFSGREHSGLDDSRNTARLAWRMICDGCVMKITKSLDKALANSSVRPGPPSAAQAHKSRQGDVTQASTIAKEDEQDSKKDRNTDKANEPRPCQPSASANQDRAKQLKDGPSNKTLINGLFTTLGNDNKDLFPRRTSLGPVKYGIQIGAFSSVPLDHSPCGRGHVLMSTTVHTVNDVSDLDMHSCSDLSILANWEEAAVIEDSQHEGPGKPEERDLVPVDSPSSAVLMLRNDQNSGQSMHRIGAANLHHKSVAYRSPDTTIYNVNMKKSATNGSGFKLPSALGTRTSAPTPSTGQTSKTATLLDYFPKRKLASVSFYSPPKKLPFTIHDGNRTLPVPTNNSRVLSNKVLSATINLNKTFGTIKCDRITAPMCQCGRRAKKLTVSNIGPNHGRVFYSCSVRKRSDENGKGCNYFKWEDTLLKEKTANASASLSTSSNRSFSSAGSSAVHKPFIKLRPSMRT